MYRKRKRKKILFNFKHVYKRRKKKKFLEKIENKYRIKYMYMLNLIQHKRIYYRNFFNKAFLNLILILQSSNFINNIYYSRQLIKHGGVLVNGLVTSAVQFSLQRWDFVSIVSKFRLLVYKLFFSNLRKFEKKIFTNKYQIWFAQKMGALFKKIRKKFK